MESPSAVLINIIIHIYYLFIIYHSCIIPISHLKYSPPAGVRTDVGNPGLRVSIG